MPHPLKTAREKKGISQVKLGIAVGLNPADISRIERWQRHPHPKWRTAISQYFNLPEYELFPTADDLLARIEELEKENQFLRKRVEELGQGTNNLHKERDYSRYVI